MDSSVSNLNKPWFVYICHCADNTYYTGITTDPERRLAEHNSDKAAKYTRARQPVNMLYIEKAADRSQASKREYAIKKLSRLEKREMIGCYKV